MMLRIEGWEERLAAVVAGARRTPFAWGTHDCLSFSCQAIEALTGVDRFGEFRGRYASEGQALRLLSELGGHWEDAARWFFGAEPVNTRFARRGDICARGDDGAIHALAVCVGARAAGLGPEGVVFAPLSSFSLAWRIG